VRPFLRSAKVIPRGCSRALQRAITDFAADQPFAQVRMKLQEHYGFEIGESTIQRIALGHAKNIFEASRVIPVFPETPGKHKDIIAQTDGGMVPIVEPDARQEDKRKGKTLSWPRRGQDFPGARQREHHAGLRGRDRGRRRNRWTTASRMRGSGRLRREFPRSCGRGRSAMDRGPSGGAVWRPGQLLD